MMSENDINDFEDRKVMFKINNTLYKKSEGGYLLYSRLRDCCMWHISNYNHVKILCDKYRDIIKVIPIKESVVYVN